MTAWTYLTRDQQIKYAHNIKIGQRKGEAWFNVLDPADQQILRGTLYDPCHSDSAKTVLRSLSYLLERKNQ